MKKIANEVTVDKVRIQDSFWSTLQERVIREVIPFQEKVLNDQVEGVAKSHAIENFRIAAGLAEGEFYGMVFQDSDVAKWLEGVAYSLTVKPDPELEGRADEIIEIIAKAQQDDGYLNTFFTIKEPEHRWQNLHECHELYCAGHMMEAAVAYYQATGKTKLLEVMERMAQHIISRFGEGKGRGIPGHQEVEIGLMKLYRVTGKPEYKDMARFFLEERGKDPDYFYKEKVRRGWSHWGPHNEDRMDVSYNQAHKPIYEQTRAVGHAVRAAYMYTAMADLAAEDGDDKLYSACKTLWDNIVNRQMYITGGVGATVEGEAFSEDYHLPNDTVYAETCASIAMVFFAKRMLEMEADGRYADILEKELYNGTISGIQLDGKRYFYVNPLEVNPGISGKVFGHKHVLPERSGWYACACCPPNLVRMVTAMGSYAWTENETTLFSHLLVGQKASLSHADITVESAYPWEGKVTYHVEPKSEKFTLAIHLPGYVKPGKASLTVNGEAVDAASILQKGYLYINRSWKSGDEVELTFDLAVRKVFANGKVMENAGKVAILRGPIVYAFEGIDNGEDIQNLRIPRELSAKAELCTEGTLAGNVILHITGRRMVTDGELYSEIRPIKRLANMVAVPYYAWGNRGETQMRVWMLEDDQ